MDHYTLQKRFITDNTIYRLNVLFVMSSLEMYVRYTRRESRVGSTKLLTNTAKIRESYAIDKAQIILIHFVELYILSTGILVNKVASCFQFFRVHVVLIKVLSFVGISWEH